MGTVWLKWGYHKMERRILSVGFGLIALVINPAFGCSSSDDSWHFTDTEMRAAVAGTYSGTLGDTTEIVTLTLDEAKSSSSSSTQSAASPRLQCGSDRSFILPASACLSGTSMAITGQISSSNGTIASSAVNGGFVVFTSNLTDGSLSLKLEDGSRIDATFKTSLFTNWQLTLTSGATDPMTLTRQ